eukprot:gene12983-15268_t
MTARDGKQVQMEQIYIRGSKIRFIILPDMLKNAPMFKRVDGKQVLKGKSLGIGRSIGRGGPPGRGGGGMRAGDIFFSLKNGEIRYVKYPFTPSSNYTFGASVSHESLHYVHTGGRPLGIHFDNDDNLLIADAVKGLLKVDRQSGDIVILTSSYKGNKLSFVNDVTTGTDGMIYFSDSTTIAPVSDKSGDWNTLLPSMFTIASANPKGKLMSFNPKTKETKMLMDGIHYANGVAIDLNNESVYVCETGSYRVLRYWLTGVNAGKSQIFIDNLPGFPDGIDMGDDGRLYIGIYGGRSKILDLIHPYPWIKRSIMRVPFFTLPIGAPYVVIADSK